MNKVYLLLRNNKQTGPFGLDELLAMGLKPYDLVWEEGKSAAWRYPGEIDSLKPYAPKAPETITTRTLDQYQQLSVHEQYLPKNEPKAAEVKQPGQSKTAKHIFVSLPAGAEKKQNQYESKYVREEKKDAAIPPERFQSTLHNPVASVADPGMDTKFNRSLNDVEEDYTNWVVQQHRINKVHASKKQILICSVVAGSLVMLFFVFRSLFLKANVDSPKNPVAVNTGSVNLVQQANDLTPNTKSEPVTKQDEHPSDLPEENTSYTSSEIKESKQEQDLNRHIVSGKMHQPSGLESHSTTPKSNEQNISERSHLKSAGQIAQNKIQPTSGEYQNKVVTKGKEIREPDLSAAPPANVIPGNGRTAMRRGSSGTEADNAPQQNTASRSSLPDNQPGESVSPDEVQVTDNHSDDWMMGINGLKVTLNNRSIHPIGNATVEINYFDENNRLLEKKMLTFRNIPSKGRLTMAAPDSKWADHVDYKVRSITPGN